jgi:anti-sigma regulatory factor (Ser/Thr protein kinase)
MCHSYWTRTFKGLPEQVADVREFIRRIVGDVDGINDIVLVASELAGNAIRHSASGDAGGSFVVQVVAFSDAWHVRVDDQGDPRHFKLQDAGEEDEAGRGLPVVSALARAWGVIGDNAGRAVWAEVSFPKDDVGLVLGDDFGREGVKHLDYAAGRVVRSGFGYFGYTAHCEEAQNSRALGSSRPRRTS